MGYVDKAIQLGVDWFLLGPNVDGSAWIDEVSNHDATLVGATEVVGNGPGDALPGYIDFDGVDDYATVPHHADFNRSGSPTTIFSWAWLTEDGNPHYHALYSKGQPNSTYRLNSSSSGRWGEGNDWQFWFGESGTLDRLADIPTEEWIMLAVLYDGTDAHIYYRGVNDLSWTHVAQRLGGGLVDNTDPFYVGARGTDTVQERFLKCRVSVIGGAHHELTFAELDELHDAAFGPTEPTFNRTIGRPVAGGVLL